VSALLKLGLVYRRPVTGIAPVSEDKVRKFGVAEANELGDLLVSRGVSSGEKAGALALVFMDIYEPVEKLYGSLIPQLLSNQEASSDRIEDVLWDIRAEFRHFDYHIHDAALKVL
jgi:hypothetical protein